MAVPPLEVFVGGKPFTLYRGATVKDALVMAAAGARLVRLVEQGRAVVYDERYDAEVGLGGALYEGQRLQVREVK